MYGEWMDAIPLLVNNYPRHNISELRKALNYWERQEDRERVEYYKKQINKEIECLI